MKIRMVVRARTGTVVTTAINVNVEKTRLALKWGYGSNGACNVDCKVRI